MPLEVGGCQQIVKKDDEVISAYVTQEEMNNFLKLSGPDWSYKGEQGIPILIRNADVNGYLTDDQVKANPIQFMYSTVPTHRA